MSFLGQFLKDYLQSRKLCDTHLGTRVQAEMLLLQLFLLIIAVDGIFSNIFVESVFTGAEISLDRSVRILVSEMKNLKDRMQKMEKIHQETVEDNRNLRTLVNSLTSKNGELERRVYSVEQIQRNRHRKDEFEDASDVLTNIEHNSNKSSVTELGPFENTMKSLSHGILSRRNTRSASGKKCICSKLINKAAQLSSWGEFITLIKEIHVHVR